MAAAGGSCELDSDCSSGLCNDNAGGVCEVVSRGGQCFDNTDCVTGLCSACDASDVCTGQRGQCLAAGAGGTCAIDRDCTTRICSTTSHTCTPAGPFGSCEHDSDCAPQLWCSPPVDEHECPEINGAFTHRFCDFNICSLPFNGYCDPNALCTPRKCGSRRCSCNDGYLGNGDLVTTPRPAGEGEGEGRRRRAHHERDNDPGCFSPCTTTSCDVNAVCTPHGHEGDIFCECNTGYIGVGTGGSGTPGNCLVDPCAETVSMGVLVTQCGPVDRAYCFADLSMPVVGPTVPYTCACMNPYYGDLSNPNAMPPNCMMKPALPLAAPASCTAALIVFFGGAAHCGCGSQHVVNTFCVANTVGGVCDIADDCTTKNCRCPRNEITCAHMRCHKSSAGGACAEDGDCTTSRCDTAFSMKCQPNQLGGRCRADTDCAAGLFCYDPLEDGEGRDGRRRDHDDDEHDDDRRCAPNKSVDTNGGCDPNAWCMPVGPELRMCTCKTALGYFGAGYEFDPAIPGSGCTNPCLVENGDCYQDPMNPANNAICTPIAYNAVQCACQPAFVGTGVTDYGCVLDMCGAMLPYVQPDSTPSNQHVFVGCPSGSHCITINVPQIPGSYLSCQPDTAGQVYVEKFNAIGQLAPDPCNTNLPAGQRALRPPNGGCGEHATCSTDFSGNVQCQCVSGYSPQGLTFRPNQHVNCLRDPCATLGANGLPDNGGCDPNALCFSLEEFDRRFGEHERHHHGFREGDFRVCVCVPPQVGDGLFCVDNPCVASSCNSFANTRCEPVFTPPGFPSGPRPTRGPTAAVSCPCLSGFVQAQAGQPVNFADCMGSCAEANGGCDATSTDCELAGNRLQCRCKPGFTSISPTTGLPAFGLVVAPGVACTASLCNYDMPPACGTGSHCVPTHTVANTCVNVAPGSTCNLACEPGYAYEHHDDTDVRCVGTLSGSFFSEPRKEHPCVPASRVPKPPSRISSAFGDGWECTTPTAPSGSADVCVPKKPRFSKGVNNNKPFITVSWKAHGSHHLKVVSVDVTISPVTMGTVKSTIDLPDGPGGAGKVTFYGLQPGFTYEFVLSVVVKNEDGTTTTYLSVPHSVTADT